MSNRRHGKQAIIVGKFADGDAVSVSMRRIIAQFDTSQRRRLQPRLQLPRLHRLPRLHQHRPPLPPRVPHQRLAPTILRNFAGPMVRRSMVRSPPMTPESTGLWRNFGCYRRRDQSASSSEFVGRIHPDSADFAGNRGIADESGHGSAVASVAAGSKNNNATHGIAFDSDILVLRTDTPGSCQEDDPDDPDDGCSHSSSVQLLRRSIRPG